MNVKLFLIVEDGLTSIMRISSVVMCVVVCVMLCCGGSFYLFACWCTILEGRILRGIKVICLC
jgi:hypothetical protein